MLGSGAFHRKAQAQRRLVAGLAGLAALALLWSFGSGGGADGAQNGAAVDAAVGTALRFISIGDFGVAMCSRRSAHRKCHEETQRKVAAGLARAAVSSDPQFVLSLGDNFYPDGVASLRDPQLRVTFEEMYALPGLAGVPWLASLGDHDHCGNVSALLAYGSAPGKSFRLPAPYYARSFRLSGRRRFHLVVIDSVALEGSMAMPSERRFEEKLDPRFTSVAASRLHWIWLESTLRRLSSGVEPRLILVVGHRPVFSAGRRGRTASEARVSDRLHSLFARYGVGAYIDGHDHNMQHLRKDGIQYFVNGVGGFDTHAVDPDAHMWPRSRDQTLVWGIASGFGFVQHKVTDAGMQLEFVHVVKRGAEPTGADSESLVVPKVVHTMLVPWKAGGFAARKT